MANRQPDWQAPGQQSSSGTSQAFTGSAAYASIVSQIDASQQQGGLQTIISARQNQSLQQPNGDQTTLNIQGLARKKGPQPIRLSQISLYSKRQSSDGTATSTAMPTSSSDSTMWVGIPVSRQHSTGDNMVPVSSRPIHMKNHTQEFPVIANAPASVYVNPLDSINNLALLNSKGSSGQTGNTMSNTAITGNTLSAGVLVSSSSSLASTESSMATAMNSMRAIGTQSPLANQRGHEMGPSYSTVISWEQPNGGSNTIGDKSSYSCSIISDQALLNSIPASASLSVASGATGKVQGDVSSVTNNQMAKSIDIDIYQAKIGTTVSASPTVPTIVTAMEANIIDNTGLGEKGPASLGQETQYQSQLNQQQQQLLQLQQLQQRWENERNDRIDRAEHDRVTQIGMLERTGKMNAMHLGEVENEQGTTKGSGTDKTKAKWVERDNFPRELTNQNISRRSCGNEDRYANIPTHGVNGVTIETTDNTRHTPEARQLQQQQQQKDRQQSVSSTPTVVVMTPPIPQSSSSISSSLHSLASSCRRTAPDGSHFIPPPPLEVTGEIVSRTHAIVQVRGGWGCANNAAPKPFQDICATNSIETSPIDPFKYPGVPTRDAPSHGAYRCKIGVKDLDKLAKIIDDHERQQQGQQKQQYYPTFDISHIDMPSKEVCAFIIGHVNDRTIDQIKTTNESTNITNTNAIIGQKGQANGQTEVDTSHAVVRSSLPKQLATALLPFQLDGVAFGLQRKGRVLYADEMGVGKTLQAIALALALKSFPVLVVTIKSTIQQTKEEIIRWAGLTEEEVLVIQRKTSTSISAMFRDNPTANCDSSHPSPKFILTTYSILQAPNILLQLSTEVSNAQITTVIVDESHSLKSPRAKRSKLLIPFILTFPHRILLSGTPIDSNPEELYTQAKMVAPGMLPPLGKYVERYGGKSRIGGVQTNNLKRGGKSTSNTYSIGATKPAEHMGELKVLMELISVRRYKKDVCSLLPMKWRYFVNIGADEIDTPVVNSSVANLNKYNSISGGLGSSVQSASTINPDSSSLLLSPSQVQSQDIVRSIAGGDVIIQEEKKDVVLVSYLRMVRDEERDKEEGIDTMIETDNTSTDVAEAAEKIVGNMFGGDTRDNEQLTSAPPISSGSQSVSMPFPPLAPDTLHTNTTSVLLTGDKSVLKARKQEREQARREVLEQYHNNAVTKAKACGIYVLRLLSLLPSHEQVVIFAHHSEVVAAVVGALNSVKNNGSQEGNKKTSRQSGSTIGVITGTVSANKRRSILNGFATGQIRCLVLSLRACNAGLNLTTARLAIICELAWTPSDMVQAEDRLHRLGQRRNVVIVYLVLGGSVDEKICRTLQMKLDVVGMCVGSNSVNPWIATSSKKSLTTIVENHILPDTALGLPVKDSDCDAAKSNKGCVGGDDNDKRVIVIDGGGVEQMDYEARETALAMKEEMVDEGATQTFPRVSRQRRREQEDSSSSASDEQSTYIAGTDPGMWEARYYSDVPTIEIEDVVTNTKGQNIHQDDGVDSDEEISGINVSWLQSVSSAHLAEGVGVGEIGGIGNVGVRGNEHGGGGEEGREEVEEESDGEYRLF